MALNIKDDHVHESVRKMAALTGESQAMAVASAVEERLRRLLAEQRTERILAIGRRAASRMSDDARTADVDVLLYDEAGLPR